MSEKSKELLSLKYITELCFFSIIAVLLAMPLYRFETAHIILAITAIITFFIIKGSIVIKSLCISVFLKSIYLLFEDYLSLSYYLSSKISFLIFIVLVIGPIIYGILKANKILTKIFLGIVIVALDIIPYLPYLPYNDINLSFILLLISLTLFFFVSAIGTTDKTTKYISTGASIACLFIIFVAITGFVFSNCDHPQDAPVFPSLKDHYNNDSISNDYSVYDSCLRIFSLSTKWLFIAGLIMASYFAIILYRSKMKLSNICFPAIVSMLGLGIILGYNSRSADIFGFGLWKGEAAEYEIVMIAEFIIMAYSFYKFFKKL